MDILQQKEQQRFLYIQILRFLAALGVLMFHSTGMLQHSLPGYNSVLTQLSSLGGYGVDLFFVISGFVICYSLNFKSVSAKEFLISRSIRLVPLYWLTTFFLCFLGLCFPSLFGATNWLDFRHTFESIFFLSFIDIGSPIIYLGWSLEFEIRFYIVVALFVGNKKANWDFVVAVLSILSLYHLLSKYGDTDFASISVDSPIILEFLFGIFIAQFFTASRMSSYSIGLFFINLCVIFISRTPSRAVLVGIPAAAIVFGAVIFSNSRSKATPIERFLAKLGDASYSIYLTQIFTISAIGKILPSLFSFNPNLLLFVMSITGVCFGFIIFLYVERPMGVRLIRLAKLWRATPVIE